MNVILAAFLLTTFAGLSTGFGSAIPFFFRKFRKSYLAFFLGLSAGVMILVSFMELLPNALENLESYYVFLAFFGGMVVVVIIDLFMPREKNPHHMTRKEEIITSIQRECMGECEEDEPIKTRVELEEINEEDKAKKLRRTGMVTALAIAIHNFPEGMATFATAISDINLGITIAVAIAIHNIPEGISVSIPIYYATKNKWKSFGLSLASGIAEPIGALVAYGILRSITGVISPKVLAISLAAVAGIMVYISIDELIPVAHEYGKGDIVMAGVVIGMVIMAASLVLFEFFT
ncbi:MAG: zinc transporter ZupT [Asgard group archaeon]|nr:zinc transporter ZupT [Asgard group archaeon]